MWIRHRKAFIGQDFNVASNVKYSGIGYIKNLPKDLEPLNLCDHCASLPPAREGLNLFQFVQLANAKQLIATINTPTTPTTATILITSTLKCSTPLTRYDEKLLLFMPGWVWVPILSRQVCRLSNPAKTLKESVARAISACDHVTKSGSTSSMSWMVA